MPIRILIYRYVRMADELREADAQIQGRRSASAEETEPNILSNLEVEDHMGFVVLRLRINKLGCNRQRLASALGPATRVFVIGSRIGLLVKGLVRIRSSISNGRREHPWRALRHHGETCLTSKAAARPVFQRQRGNRFGRWNVVIGGDGGREQLLFAAH